MRVRRTSPTGDFVFGGNQRDYWRDSPDGVAQIVESRLNLWQGQLYIDLQEGTPYEMQVLGRRTESLRDPALRTRILTTPGVTEIINGSYASALDRETRRLSVQATIDTAYSRGAGQGSTARVLTSVRVDR